MNNKTPNSFVATCLYALGALFMLPSLWFVYLSLADGMQIDVGGLTIGLLALSIPTFVTGAIIALIGGIAQMIFDIRWKLLNSDGERDA